MSLTDDELRRYLDLITITEPKNPSDPLAELPPYFTAMDSMKVRAERRAELPELRAAIVELLSGPDERLRPFQGHLYPYKPEQLRILLTHACQRLGTEAPAPLTRDRPSPEETDEDLGLGLFD